MSFVEDQRQSGGWRQRLARLFGGFGEPSTLQPDDTPWDEEDQALSRGSARRRLAEAMLRSAGQSEPFGVGQGLANALSMWSAGRGIERADRTERETEAARTAREAEALRTAATPGEDGARPTFAAQIEALGGNADPAIRRLATTLARGRLERGAEQEVDTDFDRQMESYKSDLRVDEFGRMTPQVVAREEALGPVEATNAGLRETSVRTAGEPFDIRAEDREQEDELERIRMRASVGAAGDGPLTPTQARTLAAAFGTDWEQATSASRAILEDPKVRFAISAEGQEQMLRGDATAIGSLRYGLARFSNGAGALSTADVTMSDGSTLRDSIEAWSNSVAGRGNMSRAQIERGIALLSAVSRAEQQSLNQRSALQRDQALQAGVPENMMGLVTPLWRPPDGRGLAEAGAAAGGSGGSAAQASTPEEIIRGRSLDQLEPEELDALERLMDPGRANPGR